MNTKGFWLKLTSWLLLASLLMAFSPASGASLVAQTSAGQVEPSAGKWQTWVLKSGSELRPAAPPDQAATKKEVAALQTLVAQRDAKALDQIAYWDAGSPNYRWLEIAFAAEGDLNPPRAAAQRAAQCRHLRRHDCRLGCQICLQPTASQRRGSQTDHGDCHPPQPGVS
jgi:hypothetical protein